MPTGASGSEPDAGPLCLPPSAPRPGNIQELRHMGSWFQTLVNAQICSKFFLWKTVFSIV